MPQEAIVLGNGLSRIDCLEEIGYDNPYDERFELFGCNRIFMEVLVGTFDQMNVTGGFEHLLLCKALSRKIPVIFEKTKLFAMNPQTARQLEIEWLDIPFEFFTSSGHVWAAYLLLKKKYEVIHLVGMDFGGGDLHHKAHIWFKREWWIKGWKNILDRIDGARRRLVFHHPIDSSGEVMNRILSIQDYVKIVPSKNVFYGKV